MGPPPPPPPPPFPIPVDRFVEECDGDDPAQAAQCCAAFATLATQVPVPRDFRGATRTLMELVERTGGRVRARDEGERDRGDGRVARDRPRRR